MTGRAAERDTAARQNLEQLADEFRRHGVSAEFHPERCFTSPALLVSEAGASTLMLAGYATYFRQSHDQVVTEVGTFSDLVGTVRAVREHLEEQRRSVGEVDEAGAEVNG